MKKTLIALLSLSSLLSFAADKKKSHSWQKRLEKICKETNTIPQEKKCRKIKREVVFFDIKALDGCYDAINSYDQLFECLEAIKNKEYTPKELKKAKRATLVDEYIIRVSDFGHTVKEAQPMDRSLIIGRLLGIHDLMKAGSNDLAIGQIETLMQDLK